MNIYEFIKYRIFKMRKPEEFKAGQVWQQNGPDPFRRGTITIVDTKDGYVQFVYNIRVGTKHSSSMDYIRSAYTLLRQ